MSKESPNSSLSPAERRDKFYELDRTNDAALRLLGAKRNEAAVKMEDFEDVPGYGEERVRRDKEKARKKMAEFEAAGTTPPKRALLLEGVLFDQIELGNWFGESAYTMAPSNYDDLFHGVDLAVGIKEDADTKKHLALGVDVTSSAVGIVKKLQRIKQRIQNGQLTAIEYFHSEEYDPDFYGTMNNVPYVVVGAWGKTINELGELWMSAYGLLRTRDPQKDELLTPEGQESSRRRAKEAIQKLAKHKVQVLLLEEIRMQLVVFHKFAEKEGQKQVAEKLSSTLNSISSILETKKGLLSAEEELQNGADPVFQALKYALADFDNL